jgi:transcriptional regulator with XRE-family HTH domain
MEFREFFKRRRKELKMSQADVADQMAKLGFPMTDGRISHWESGRNRPPIHEPEFRSALAMVLQLPVMEMLEILGYGVDDVPQSEEAKLAAQIVDRLPPDDRRKALNILKALENP